VSDFIIAGADRIFFHIVIIVFSFLNGAQMSGLFGCREGGSLPLIPSDFKKLLADRVFWGVNVLDIRLKERLIPVLTEIYLGSWSELLNRNQMECALNLVPPIAAITYLFDHWQRFGAEHGSEPNFESSIRAIARQIDRAAHDIQLRRVRCA